MSGAAVWRPSLDLDAAGRAQLARLLAECAARAAAGVPVPGARPILAVMTALSAAATGDGPVEAPVTLTESQAGALREVLDKSASRARTDLDPAATALTELARQWGQRIGYRGEPLPAGRAGERGGERVHAPGRMP